MQKPIKFAGLVALCVVLAACLNNVACNKAEMMNKYLAAVDLCVAEVGASTVKCVAHAADKDDVMNDAPVTRREGKCLHACLMKKFAVMDADGKFVRAVGMEHAKMITGGDADRMKVAIEIIDDCDSLDVSPDHCEAATQYGACFKRQSAARGLHEFQI